MPHAGRTDACYRQLIIKPRRSAITEVITRRPMHWRKHLQNYERDANGRKWTGERSPALHRCNQDSHCNRENRGEHASKHKSRPPQERKGPVRGEKHAEEPPLFARGEARDHGLSSFLGALLRHAVLSAPSRISRVTFFRWTRVEPCRPHPPGTGEKIAGASVTIPACCSGVNISTPNPS